VTTRARLLESFAALLEYPTPGFREYVGSACAEIGVLLHNLGIDDEDRMEKFRDGIVRCSVNELEELYTRTFDLNPVCTLDVGWHLYEENYDRGTFLVQMREALRRHGIPETTELPDHLPSVLKVLARASDQEGAPLVRDSVLPAMKKMLKAFTESDNPYGKLLQRVEMTLQSTFLFPSGVPNHD